MGALAEGMDLFVALGLFVSFAAWIALHVALMVGLASNGSRWQALLCMVPPCALLAPYWGYRVGLRGPAASWLAAAAAYGACLVLAFR